MFHMGKYDGAPLIKESFEAWNYGPVVPELYHRMKPFGADPVGNVFHWVSSADPSSAEFDSLRAAAEGTKSFNPGQLVANTHWEKGAWANVYKPNIRGIKIPNSAILNEFIHRRH